MSSCELYTLNFSPNLSREERDDLLLPRPRRPAALLLRPPPVLRHATASTLDLVDDVVSVLRPTPPVTPYAT